MNTPVTQDQTVLKKIKQLLALSESAASISSQHEAEVALQKAQELMLQHNLSEMDIELSEKRGFGSIIAREINFEKWFVKTESDWVEKLIYTVCFYNFCKALKYRGEQVVQIFGTEQNIEVCLTLVEYYREVAKSLAVTATRTFAKQNPGGNKNSFKRAYLRGLVLGLQRKLADTQSQSVEETGGRAIAIFDKNKADLENAIQDHYPGLKLKTKNSTELSERRGFISGVNDSSKLNSAMGSGNYAKPSGYLS